MRGYNTRRRGGRRESSVSNIGREGEGGSGKRELWRQALPILMAMREAIKGANESQGKPLANGISICDQQPIRERLYLC